MNDSLNGPWLSEEEVLLHRVESFHRGRTNTLVAGETPVGTRQDGVLLVHLIPVSSFRVRIQYEGTFLKEHGKEVGAQNGFLHPRFNVDGFMLSRTGDGGSGYAQLFRNGSLEIALTDVFRVERTNREQKLFRDVYTEESILRMVNGYSNFCKSAGLTGPFQLHSAIVGCKDVCVCMDWSWREFTTFGVDRSPAILPALEIPDFGEPAHRLLRPWCDLLWQAFGLERSLNYDQNGNWRERK